MGTANATVFPVPVLDPPMQSLPFNISGIHDRWISVGFVMAMEFREWTSHGETSRDSNEDAVMVAGVEIGVFEGFVSGTVPFKGAVLLILEGPAYKAGRSFASSSSDLRLRFAGGRGNSSSSADPLESEDSSTGRSFPRLIFAECLPKN